MLGFAPLSSLALSELPNLGPINYGTITVTLAPVTGHALVSWVWVTNPQLDEVTKIIIFEDHATTSNVVLFANSPQNGFTAHTFASSQKHYDVTVSPQSGKFMVVTGSNVAQVSSDGVTWTNVTVPGAPTSIQYATYNTEDTRLANLFAKHFFVGYTPGTATSVTSVTPPLGGSAKLHQFALPPVEYSTDEGVTWQSIANVYTASTHTSNLVVAPHPTLNNLDWYANVTMGLVLGSNPPSYIVPNGTPSVYNDYDILGVYYGNATQAPSAYGDTYTSDPTGGLSLVQDNINNIRWVTPPGNISSPYYSRVTTDSSGTTIGGGIVGYGITSIPAATQKYIAISDRCGVFVMNAGAPGAGPDVLSTDIHTSSGFANNILNGATITSLVWTGQWFVAVGSGSNVYAYSGDGIHWVTSTLPKTGNWGAIAFSLAQFITSAQTLGSLTSNLYINVIDNVSSNVTLATLTDNITTTANIRANVAWTLAPAVSSITMVSGNGINQILQDVTANIVGTVLEGISSNVTLANCLGNIQVTSFATANITTTLGTTTQSANIRISESGNIATTLGTTTSNLHIDVSEGITSAQTLANATVSGNVSVFEGFTLAQTLQDATGNISAFGLVTIDAADNTLNDAIAMIGAGVDPLRIDVVLQDTKATITGQASETGSVDITLNASTSAFTVEVVDALLSASTLDNATVLVDVTNFDAIDSNVTLDSLIPNITLALSESGYVTNTLNDLVPDFTVFSGTYGVAHQTLQDAILNIQAIAFVTIASADTLDDAVAAITAQSSVYVNVTTTLDSAVANITAFGLVTINAADNTLNDAIAMIGVGISPLRIDVTLQDAAAQSTGHASESGSATLLLNDGTSDIEVVCDIGVTGAATLQGCQTAFTAVCVANATVNSTLQDANDSLVISASDYGIFSSNLGDAVSNFAVNLKDSGTLAQTLNNSTISILGFSTLAIVVSVIPNQTYNVAMLHNTVTSNVAVVATGMYTTSIFGSV